MVDEVDKNQYQVDARCYSLQPMVAFNLKRSRRGHCVRLNLKGSPAHARGFRYGCETVSYPVARTLCKP